MTRATRSDSKHITPTKKNEQNEEGQILHLIHGHRGCATSQSDMVHRRKSFTMHTKDEQMDLYDSEHRTLTPDHPYMCLGTYMPFATLSKAGNTSPSLVAIR